jgi:hypothetical protein
MTPSGIEPATFYDVETKVQSSQWIRKLSPRPKGMSESLKCEGNIDFFFDWKGIVHNEFVPRGETVNKDFYLNVLKHLTKAE